MVRLKKGENPNRPRRGTRIKVEPIKSLRDIRRLKKILWHSPRDYCLLVVGINCPLTASQLLSIKVDQVRRIRPMDEIQVKSRKPKRIRLNHNAIESIQHLLKSGRFDNADYLFKSQRAPVLGVNSMVRIVKAWCVEELKLNGSFGSHTLRKTWGYHQHMAFGTDIRTLMKCFGHNTQRQTMGYLCIDPNERDIFINEL